MPENEIIPPPPDPPAEASVDELTARIRPLVDAHLDAIEPIIRAQVLAEVDAALRDEPAWKAFVKTQRNRAFVDVMCAYLRDTLTPEGDRP